MTTTQKEAITIATTVNAPLKKVWELWNDVNHIVKWNSPSPDWHTPKASNDLVAGGNFSFRMEAKDGSFGFDFGGTYDEVKTNELIKYTLGDGRKVKIVFTTQGNTTTVTETFDPEDVNPVDFQRAGWQAIIDNFKKYAEANA